MTVFQSGQLNTTALIVADVYVGIVPPRITQINGLPTNVVGGVGTAPWGPVNSQQTIATMANYDNLFGGIRARKYDLGTQIAAAVLQGANNFRCIRVTDGTDTAASGAITPTATNTLTFTVQPTAAQTATIGGTAVTFVSALTTGNQVLIGATLSATLMNLILFLNASVDTNLSAIAYSLSGSVVSMSVKAPGAAGNSTTLATNVTGATVGGATFSGGSATTALTITSKYTGSGGNTTQVTTYPGSQIGTYRVTVGVPGLVPENYDNIGAGLTGNAVWVAIANAINSGISGQRGPSGFIVAAAGAQTGAPPPNSTYTLSGGTDGASGVTYAHLVGNDASTPRTGMYALRGTGTSVAFLADCDTAASYTTQAQFGLSEGIYMIATGPAGDTITNAITVKAASGIDSYPIKILHGDWPLFDDRVNGLQRLISPVGYSAGRLGALSPEQSSLNKPLYGILSTQRTAQGQPYSSAEIQQLVGAGIDVITNPAPGGSYFAARTGHNSSSNSAVSGDNYTRMTNFLAYTFNSSLGDAVGRPITQDLMLEQKARLSDFLTNLQNAGMIDSFSIVLDLTNNPPARTSAGYLQADVQVRYLSILEKFLINLEGGATVVTSRVSTQAFN